MADTGAKTTDEESEIEEKRAWTRLTCPHCLTEFPCFKCDLCGQRHDARRQLGAGQEEIVQEVGANFSCAHFIISQALLGLYTTSSQQSSRLGVLSNSVREGVESA